MKEEIQPIIFEAVREINAELGGENLASPTLDTALYGADGNLDSMGLVSLLMDIEDRVSEKLGKDVALTDEKAMSQRNSPFKSVRTLADYMERLLNGSV